MIQNKSTPRAGTTGSSRFTPDGLFQTWTSGGRTLPQNDDLCDAIIRTFSLPEADDYVYHAMASVTLAQVQEAVAWGRQRGLHAWYRDNDGKVLEYPRPEDAVAYTTIFSPLTTPTKALMAFKANAKRGSMRARSAEYLCSRRLLPDGFTIARCKNHANPALDFWSWSCHVLEWCGPVPESAAVHSSHHILPIFMHHFGCVVPSFESLEVIRQISQGQTPSKRRVLDVGSGNGYWTYMLRRQGIPVLAIDNLQSRWRTLWIDDTLIEDGAKFLKQQSQASDILLLVYPIVGADFTKSMLDAYQGTTVIVAGTQNRNGYTAFRDSTIDDWMEQQNWWQKSVQIALPSFAGKDEALFVFERASAGDLRSS